MAISKIKTVSIEDDAITTGKILNDAVTGAKIPAGAVVADIADDSIAGGKFTNDIAISTTGAITTTGAFTSAGIDDNADANAITIDSSEKVGIGTTSPQDPLHVYLASGQRVARFEANDTTSAFITFKASKVLLEFINNTNND